MIEPNERDLSGKGHVLLTTRIGLRDMSAVIEGERSYEELLECTVDIDFRVYIPSSSAGHELANRVQGDLDRSRRQAEAFFV